MDKHLWIHSDEKGFFGFLRRANANMCEELGIGKQQILHKHQKSCIEKAKVVAITAYVFHGSPYDGGDGLEIGIHQVQATKITKKEQKELDANQTALSKAYSSLINQKETSILLMSVSLIV
jgi:hypothetical protein